MKKGNFFQYVVGLSALLVAGSAAYYSVFGLSKLFSGAMFAVVVMAGSLEFAKLVSASFLYRYWNKINKNPQKKQIDYVDWIELIKFKETRNYVQRVLENYNVYRYILEQKPIKLKNLFKNDPLF